MKLNDIHLSSSVIADLYKSSLIEINQTSDQVSKEVIATNNNMIVSDNYQNEWKYLGNNKKNILILVKYDNDNCIHLPDDHLNFLINMLSACKISLDDVAIMNLHNHPQASYNEIINQFKSKIVFLFGVEPIVIGMPISFPHFQVQSFSKCTFLFTPEMEDLKKDNVFKSKLWVCLRRIFSI